MKKQLVSLSLIIFIAASGFAQSAPAKRPITVEDLWAVKRVGAPSVSPDGRWVAVEVTSYNMQENNSSSDIWLLATDGRTQRRLTTHTARDAEPQWSPNGQWIAFVSKRDGDEQNQIYLISPEGGEARRLTKIPTGASAIKWFRDSTHLAFISWVWPDLSTDEEQAKRLKERQDAKVKAYVIETTNYRYWDRWLADGRVPHLFVINVQTGERWNVLAGSGIYIARDEPSAALYDISPDGREIALTVDLSKDPGFDPNLDIVTIPARGGSWRNLTSDNPANDSRPRYSPDGSWLAYTRHLIKYAPDRQRVTLINRRTADRQALADNWDYSVNELTWASDSQRLYVTAEDKGRQPIWLLPLTGGQPRRLIEGGTHLNFALSDDGRTIAFVRTSMDVPSTLYAASSDGSDVRKIETFNDQLTAQWQLGPVKEFYFKGWGGESVQMWVIYPPNFDPQKKWPLLHAVHGGPHNAWLDQFHFRWNMHLLASRGHVVAAVNFHGSTGWGDAFTDSIKGQYGTKELEDIERATDFLIAQGYIDPQRLAAAGGSFGGYMVAWMNGHTDRYKAYVCHAGVYDWAPQMASDYVRGRERALGGFHWDNPQGVEKQSARAYAKNFKTPTLITHGELDYRVPVTHGFAYYATLRMLGVPARLVYFPDENHWILKPQNSRLWHQEFFNWIETYIGAGPTDPARLPPEPVSHQQRR